MLAEYNFDYRLKSQELEGRSTSDAVPEPEGYGICYLHRQPCPIYHTYIASHAQPQIWTEEVRRKTPQC